MKNTVTMMKAAALDIPHVAENEDSTSKKDCNELKNYHCLTIFPSNPPSLLDSQTHEQFSRHMQSTV